MGMSALNCISCRWAINSALALIVTLFVSAQCESLVRERRAAV